MNIAAPNWYPDPYGRYQQRYFDGSNWTAHVVDAAGTQTIDAAPFGGDATHQTQQAQPSSGGWGQEASLQQPPQHASPQQQPAAGGWNSPSPQQAPSWGQPPQQRAGWGDQPQQQPPQQFGQHPRQPQAGVGQQHGGFGAPATGAANGVGDTSSPVTTNFVGIIIAGVAVVLLVVSLFALNLVSGEALGETGGLDRSEVSEAFDELDNAREAMREQASAMGASMSEAQRDELQSVYDDLSVGFVTSSFFSFGWIIALVAGLAAAASAVFRLSALRFATAAAAVVCAVWLIVASMGVGDPLTALARALDSDASLGIGPGAWLAVLGLLAAAAGAIVAHFQDRSSAA